MGTNVHLVAIAARNIHIATIDPANDFKIQHMNVIPPHESLLLNHEKCWVSPYLTLTRPIGLPPHAPVAQKSADQR